MYSSRLLINKKKGYLFVLGYVQVPTQGKPSCRIPYAKIQNVFVRNSMTNYAQRIFMLLILTFTIRVTSVIYSEHQKICG